MAIVRREPPNMASNAGGVGRNCDSGVWTNTWLSIDDYCSAQSTTDGRPCSIVYNSYGSRLFTHRSRRISEYAEEKRTEHNLFVRSSKSEAEVTNNSRLHSTYCRHTAKANCMTDTKHRAVSL